ncbi:MAG TPA: hypothetical protein VD859_15505 [Nocardioides sp.]|nr:hypothetical protein [Nocardioides sp.]
MSKSQTYEYARLWVPLYDDVALAVTRPVYLVEAADGIEGFVAEKNTTLVGVLNELGRDGWRVSSTPLRVADPSPEFQLLIDATLDELDGGTGESVSEHSAGRVAEFDVYAMRRRA